MSNQRSHVQPGDVSDPRVSEHYRELATERAPASLNEAVLRRAVRAAGTGYARSIAWMRPMAWAATIGLCLAIVVELADVAQPDLGEIGGRSGEHDTARAPAAADEPLSGQVRRADEATAFHVTDAPILEEAAAMARMRDGPGAGALQSTIPQRAFNSGSPACDAESTATPESWLECIEKLRDDDRLFEADEQAAALAAAFPDFEIP